METTIENIDGVKRLKITVQGIFREKESRQLKDIVLEKISNVGSVELNLWDIEEIDITGIQVCYSIRDYCKRNKVAINISVHLSQTVSQLLARCGLNNILN